MAADSVLSFMPLKLLFFFQDVDEPRQQISNAILLDKRPCLLPPLKKASLQFHKNLPLTNFQNEPFMCH